MLPIVQFVLCCTYWLLLKTDSSLDINIVYLFKREKKENSKIEMLVMYYEFWY